MTLQQAMDDLAAAKADLDDNPNNRNVIEVYNKAVDNYKSIRNDSI